MGVFYFCTMIDYLIIGSGLAGIAFAETALDHGKSIFVFDNQSQNSSRVAGGLYNPVILKRFSGLQHAQLQLDLLQQFYNALERKLSVKVNHHTPIYRKFFSVEEQNNWFAASDKPTLSPFLSTRLISKSFDGIDSPFGYGEVLQSGYVDTAVLLESYRQYLTQNQWMSSERFDYSTLKIETDCIRYGEIAAKHIIFAEGFGIHANPFFNHLPLAGTKGEMLLIKARDLQLDVVIKGNVFVLPLGNGLFKIGATYNWDDKTNLPSEDGKKELIEKTNEILKGNYEIIDQLAGIRPTVKDRKPLLGTHRQYQNVHVLNGLGTRGVMLAPYSAHKLFDSIESAIPIERELNISRFED